MQNALEQVRWWCAATGEPWSWSWRAYPGVWLFGVLLVIVAARWSRASRDPASASSWSRARLSGVTGAALAWLALDWPIGPLGTGYLASVHAVQFFVLGMLVPPMLLVGVRARAGNELARRPRAEALMGKVTQPLLAMIAFTVTMGVTHVPAVVDALMRSQLGALLLDLSWLVSGLVFWWPVIIRSPARSRFAPPLQMLYLFFGTQAHLLIGMWLLVSKFPVYGIYELAPPTGWVSALEDQQIAGGVLLLLGGPYVLGAMSVIFFRWQGRGMDGAGRALA